MINYQYSFLQKQMLWNLGLKMFQKMLLKNLDI